MIYDRLNEHNTHIIIDYIYQIAPGCRFSKYEVVYLQGTNSIGINESYIRKHYYFHFDSKRKVDKRWIHEKTGSDTTFNVHITSSDIVGSSGLMIFNIATTSTLDIIKSNLYKHIAAELRNEQLNSILE